MLFTSLLCTIPACNNQKAPQATSAEKRKKELEKKEEERKEKLEEAREEAREKHREMQTKETRKRMKRNRKKARRYNQGNKDFFLIRWYKQLKYKIKKW